MNNLTILELKKICKQNNIKKYSSLNKKNLISLIKAHKKKYGRIKHTIKILQKN